ncbi:MAG: type IV secretory system conjugative DNA transfer family protein [Clostridia bacterium]|nr:type IV secretory system conjugative DNA transfer family protein [Clostridia bacterium]
MQTYGQIPDFNKKISTVRSRGIALIPILQNLGQFQNRYPNGLADEIIGNCDTRIDMGITDVLTAEYFCDLIGVSTVETTSIRKANSIEGDIIEYGQKNISKQQRNLLNVDEILRIPSNKLLLNLRGNKPLQLDKMIYTEHILASKLKPSSINEYNPKWIKNTTRKVQSKEKIIEKPMKKEKLEWNTF